MSFGTTAVDILAGLMQGLCEMVAEDLGVLESTVDRQVSVVLGGGAMAASVWWRQAFAAALAPRDVSHQRNPEIGATGAALVALGQFEEAAGLADIGRTDELISPTTAGPSRPQDRS